MTKNCYNLFTKHYRTHNHNFIFICLPLHLLPSRCCLGCRMDSIHFHDSKDDLKKGMNLFCSSYRPGAIIHPILQIVLVQNSLCGKEINQFCPLSSSDDLCLLFFLYPSSMLPRFQWAAPTYSVRMRCPSEIDQWASRYRGTTSKQFR